MLQNIRDNSQGIIAKAIIALIVVVFAIFGLESIRGGFTTLPPAFEVNGEEILQQQLEQEINRITLSLGDDPDSVDQEQVQAFARNSLIQEALIRQSAEADALTVSDAMVDQAITSNPDFQLGGVYDQNLAGRTILSYGYSVPQYRELVRQQLVRSQLIGAYMNSNFVLDNELQDIAQLVAQTRDFRHLQLRLGGRTTDTPIADADIAAYYAENPQQFTEEETVAVDYVLLRQDDIAAGVEVSEESLLSLYEQEREAFASTAERRAAHILFDTSGEMNQEEALAAATAARQRLTDGEDFAALAAELSADTASAEQGGDIGYSSGDVFPPEIEAVLGGLEVNEVSEPVISEFGVHLVKLTEAASAEFRAFDDMREELEAEAKSAEVELMYTAQLEEMSNLAFESGDLQPISDTLGLEILQSETFARSGGVGPFAAPEVVETAFSDSVLLDGNNSEVVEISDSEAMVLRLRESTPATLRSLEDSEAEISVLLRAAMERQAVQEAGQSLLAALQAGESADALLAAEGVQWVSEQNAARDGFRADDSELSGQEINPYIVRAAFAMPLTDDGSVSYDSVTLPDGSVVIIELSGITPGSLEDMPFEERALLVQQLQFEMGQSDLSAYVIRMQRAASIRDFTPATDL